MGYPLAATFIQATEDTEYRNSIDTCEAIPSHYTDPLIGCQWHLSNTGQDSGQDGRQGAMGEDINVAEVWSGGNLGADVNVAIVDDGLYSAHEDLTENVDTTKNHDYTGNSTVFTPHYAHGTRMAGIIAARDNELGTRGVAPRAKVYAYNLVHSPTSANMADAFTRDMAATAVSFHGWGLTETPAPQFAPAVLDSALVKGVNDGFGDKGVFYTIAAGNGGLDGGNANLSEIANHYAVTTVCAVNDDGNRTFYSEQGSNLWVCAPSSGFPRDMHQSLTTTEPFDRYTKDAGGTAAAAAAVSGVAALVRKANADLTWRDVKLILAASARKNSASSSGWTTGALKYGSTEKRYNFNHRYGFGVVDAKAAVDLATGWTTVPALRTRFAESPGLSLSIPESSPPAESHIRVAGGIDFIEYVELEVHFAHRSFRDLSIELVSPSGTVSTLVEEYQSTGRYPLTSKFRLGSARHLGESATGIWTLRVQDKVSGNTGRLRSWSITAYGQGAPADVPVIETIRPTGSTLTVTWTIPDDEGVTAYDVRHIATSASDKSDDNWTVIDDAWTTTTGRELRKAITGLTGGTSYDVQVRAVRDSTDGSWSPTVAATPVADPSGAPSLGTFREYEKSLHVSWTPPSGVTVQSYGLRYIRGDAADKSDSNWTVVANAGGSTARAYTIKGLQTGVHYDVQVRAVTSGGDGSWSTKATAVPKDFADTLEQALDFDLGTTLAGTLDSPGDTDWVRVQVTGTPDVVVYTTGHADTRGTLRNASGASSWSNDDNTIDDNTLGFKIIQKAPAAGTYYIEVKNGSSIGGDYELHIETGTDTTSTSNAATLALGGSVESVLDSTSDVDYYKITLSAQTDLILRSTGRTNAKGELLRQNGTTSVANNTVGRLIQGPYSSRGDNNFLIRQSLAAGTYYLKVTVPTDGSGGSYAVHASAASAPGSTRATAATLTLDVAGAATLSADDDVDYFSVTVSEAGQIGFTATGSPATGNLLVAGELQDADGTTLQTFGRFRADRQVGFRGLHYLEPGTYYVKVTGSTSTSRAAYVLLAYTFGEHARKGAKCIGAYDGFKDPLANCQWHLYRPGNDRGLLDLNLSDVWDEYKGDGVNVAVVDNEFHYKHPDLRANFNEERNHSYVSGQTVEWVSNEANAHGTSTSGIIGAVENGIGMVGIAPEVTLYGFNAPGANVSDANDADAMTRHMSDTAVSNNSWGPQDGALQRASGIWKAAIKKGVTEGNGGKGISYIWAAGNGYAQYEDHANYDEYANHWGVTAVNSLNHNGTPAGFSEPGANIWVSTPTHSVRSTTRHNKYTESFGGTSASAPMVSGVVALMRQANTALSWRDVKLILAETSRMVDPDNPTWDTGALVYGSTSERYTHSYFHGFGLVDAKAAVERAKTWTILPAMRTLETELIQVNTAVPDDSGVTLLTSTVAIDIDMEFIEYIVVKADMNHRIFREMRVELISPNGRVVDLSTDVDDEMLRYRTGRWEGTFTLGVGRFLGESVRGEWTLRMTDHYGTDSRGDTYAGTLKSWKMTFYGHGDYPGTPQIDTFTAGERTATVTWTAPTETDTAAVTAYDARYSIDDGATWTLLESIWSTGALSYVFSGLTTGDEMSVQVRAVSSAGKGGWSPVMKATPTVPAPTAPSIESVTPSDASLGVTWTAPSGVSEGEVIAYDIRYILTSEDETDDANWTVVDNAWTSGALQYLQSGLTNNSEYDVQVLAVNATGDGAWSATTAATPTDVIDIEVAWVTSATSVSEGAGSVTLQASMVTKQTGTLPAGFSQEVVVGVSGTTISPTDYTLTSATLTFTQSDFSAETIDGQPRHKAVKDVTITIIDDDVDEMDEEMTVTLGYTGLILPHQKGDGAVVTVTITSEDAGVVRVGWEKTTLRVGEADGTVTLQVFAQTAQDQAPPTGFVLRATVSTIADSALRNADFTPVTYRITFGASDFMQTTVDGQSLYRATQAIEVALMDDTLDELDEELLVVLALLNPSQPGIAGSPAVARVIIEDDDEAPVVLSWSDASATLAEEDGTLSLTAQVTTLGELRPETGFTVDLTAATADGTATQPEDYTAVSEDFSLNASDFTAVEIDGQSRYRATKGLTVTVLTDTADEPIETFTVTLSYRGTLTPALTGGDAVANVSLTDSNQANVTLEWSAVTLTGAEPTTSGGTTTVTLTAIATTALENAPDPGFDLQFTVMTADGAATQPADYTSLSSMETFAVADFVSVMVDGNQRYRASRDIAVTIADDAIDEPDETFTATLALEDTTIPYLSTGNVTATVTITDNDHVPVALSWAGTAPTVNEGAATLMMAAHVTTTKDKAPEIGFTVDLSIASADMGASAGADYTAVNETFTFDPSDFSAVDVGGQQRYRATRTIDVALLDDTTDEDTERFTVTLAYRGAAQPHLTGGDAQATVTITDNDHVPVTMEWDAIQYTVEEPTSPSGSSTLTLTVRAVTVKDKQPDTGFTFDYSVQTADDVATSPDDYAALSTTGTISRSDFSRSSVDGQFRWVAQKEHSIDIAYDTANEGLENFTASVAYVTPGPPHLLEGNLVATISITDDLASLADLETTVVPSATTVSRGDQLTYTWTVANDGPAASTVTNVTLTLDPQMLFVSATPSGQCTEAAGVVTCTVGTIEKDASATGTVVASVSDAAAADIAFTAEAQGDQLERTPGNNEAALATSLNEPPEPVSDLRARVTATYVDLLWTAPSDNGSALLRYELERKTGEEEFTAVMTPPETMETTWRDEEVDLGTEYVYRLRAVNEDGNADWSEELSATPRVPPSLEGEATPPRALRFAEGFAATRSVGAKGRGGTPVGEPIIASHPDDLAITYTLSGRDASLFTVDADSGQIRVAVGADLVQGRTYSLNLTATGSDGAGVIIIVRIEVTASSLSAYDFNGNNRIEREEAIAAVRDYYDGTISKEQAIEVIRLYFAGDE